ncbi:DUF3006 domain-containing protein [Phosphitispora fastidiosa]|uniref:DUF3006 domain-containing protein n=1 Tax=Phosphitispora fastidiosa TaxID=2837202 RepID=UPI001E3A7B59|nr:DUF3006 domain-containing protein [Phosphitispora fastidiosa]MBU7006675.1 hypothetical protein [Phosphitispora fastidiosa]
MLLTVEKMEGSWVIIEWGKDTFRIPKFLVPGGVKEGDQIKIAVSLPTDSARLRLDKGRQVITEDPAE